MNFNLEATIWYGLLVDCVGVLVIAFFFSDWYRKNLPSVHKYFPLSKGWCFTYTALVAWLGALLFRFEVLPW
jgi:hypothetical protein